jgi:hypothetical protein
VSPWTAAMRRLRTAKLASAARWRAGSARTSASWNSLSPSSFSGRSLPALMCLWPFGTLTLA